MGMFDQMTIDCECGWTANKQFKDMNCNGDVYNLSSLKCKLGWSREDNSSFEDLSTGDLLQLLAVKYGDPDFDVPLDGVDNFMCANRDCFKVVTPVVPKHLRRDVLEWLLED